MCVSIGLTRNSMILTTSWIDSSFHIQQKHDHFLVQFHIVRVAGPLIEKKVDPLLPLDAEMGQEVAGVLRVLQSINVSWRQTWLRSCWWGEIQ